MTLTRSPGNRRLIALLGAFCFFLSLVEFMIPRPLPFIRLGLANLPLLLALDILPFPSFLILIALKVFGQALISGTLFSYVFLFSLGGSAVSAILMYALRRGLGAGRISLIGVSAAGAMASNAVQLLMAYYLIFGQSVRFVAAPVLALGIVTGTLLGIFAEYFIGRSKWYNNLNLVLAEARSTQRTQEEEKELVNSSLRKAREEFCLKLFAPAELALAGLCMMAAMLFNQDTTAMFIQFLFFFFLAWLSGKKINLLFTVSVMFTIVFFNLLVPYGQILFSLGPLAVTSGALQAGINRALMFQGLFMLSKCCVRPDLIFPGAFGSLAGESLRIFGRLTEEKKAIGKKNWVAYVDSLLISYTENAAESPVEERRQRSSGQIFASRLVLAAAVILSWLPNLLLKLG